MTKQQVKNWMRRNVIDDNATLLAESAVNILNLPESWLDDETHWIWEIAQTVTENFVENELAIKTET